MNEHCKALTDMIVYWDLKLPYAPDRSLTICSLKDWTPWCKQGLADLGLNYSLLFLVSLPLSQLPEIYVKTTFLKFVHLIFLKEPCKLFLLLSKSFLSYFYPWNFHLISSPCCCSIMLRLKILGHHSKIISFLLVYQLLQMKIRYVEWSEG